MEIINKSYLKFNEEERDRLRYMTLYDRSFIRDNIDDNPEEIDVFVATQKNGEIDEFLGWGIVIGWLPKWKLFMVYIHPLYRLKGIGTILAKMAKQKHKNIGMVRDFTSKKFIDKLCKEINIYTVEDL